MKTQLAFAAVVAALLMAGWRVRQLNVRVAVLERKNVVTAERYGGQWWLHVRTGDWTFSDYSLASWSPNYTNYTNFNYARSGGPVPATTNGLTAETPRR
jgi:hypothetical protein